MALGAWHMQKCLWIPHIAHPLSPALLQHFGGMLPWVALSPTHSSSIPSTAGSSPMEGDWRKRVAAPNTMTQERALQSLQFPMSRPGQGEPEHPSLLQQPHRGPSKSCTRRAAA